MYCFPSSFSGYRQCQRYRGRLGSALPFFELLNLCVEHTCSWSARSGTDKFPRGAGSNQTAGYPCYWLQLGCTCRWFHWQKHQWKSGQSYRSVLLFRRDFRRSRYILFSVKHILPNRCLLIVHHHFPTHSTISNRLS